MCRNLAASLTFQRSSLSSGVSVVKPKVEMTHGFEGYGIRPVITRQTLHAAMKNPLGLVELSRR